MISSTIRSGRDDEELEIVVVVVAGFSRGSWTPPPSNCCFGVGQ